MLDKLGERIQRALDELPSEYRLLLLLVADQELSYEQVGDLTRQTADAVRGKLQLEQGTGAAAQTAALAARGHTVEVVPMISGLGFLMRHNGGWLGAADPRRDGIAQGR